MNAALITDPTLIFFIVLAIILLAPMLLNRLKIPHIIGMIVAGVLIGPYGFHLLDNDASFKIFGQVGLLYLMFLAAIEIDFFHLRRNLSRGAVFGLLTFLIPLVLGFLSGIYFFNTDLVTALLLASMYASHTLISYPVAVRFGITKAPAVLMAIVGTIIAVIGALLTLATAVNVHTTGYFSFLQIGILLAKLIAFCLGVSVVYRYMARKFLRKYPDRVMQFVFILALVFFAAWLAAAIGLEGVLGAFFAGLVLNRFVPNTSPLMARLEFVGNALFIPYFLIGIGMMIDVRVIASLDTLRIAGIMLGVALVAKWLAAWIAAKIYGMKRDDCQVMFGLTTAHTAVALAVVSVGYSFGLLDTSMLNATVLMILITCAIAPMATSGAAGRIKLRMLEEAPVIEMGPENTLVPVDNPITAVALMEVAMMIHPSDRTESGLMAVHVRTSNSAAARANSDASLKLAREASATVDVPVTTIERYDANIASGLLNTINERDISCIVMGLHRRTSLVDSFFGQKLENILEQSNRMFFICRLFNPVNTLRRMVVVVPPKAEFESGFRLWVVTLGRLARNLGCRIICICFPKISSLISGILNRERIDVRLEFRNIEQWDDFVLLTNRIADDDLLAVVSARPGSLSYGADVHEMNSFLQKYFTQSNLIVIFPQQSEKNADAMTFIDPINN
ncbi:MAG: cation:proton antiporter [Bacteroides sp.]|nr:cation:proton antiporter [Bacteroides sp.]MCM1379420.1 cation:proton antiporter [Bacteroides sp.]MCM1445280.1 cation:proton antiporter [Prevotella sp.]